MTAAVLSKNLKPCLWHWHTPDIALVHTYVYSLYFELNDDRMNGRRGNELLALLTNSNNTTTAPLVTVTITSSMTTWPFHSYFPWLSNLVTSHMYYFMQTFAEFDEFYSILYFLKGSRRELEIRSSLHVKRYTKYVPIHGWIRV
jgi:hypothetical protein